MTDTKEAMTWLGEQPDTLFLGQAVGCPGTKMSESLDGVPDEKRIEFPVAENLQLGVSIGLALEGFVPVSVFPRINFLLCAADQLVLHLDKLPLYSDYRPKVIIRTAVGAKHPLNAGPQHTGDYSEPLAHMLETVRVFRHFASSPFERKIKSYGRRGTDWEFFDGGLLGAYQRAYESDRSTLVVEG